MFDDSHVPADYEQWESMGAGDNVHPFPVSIPNSTQPISNDDDKKKTNLLWLSDAVKSIKPMQWLIKGLIPAKSLIFLHAPPKVGKTFVAIDWACSIAANQAYHGLPIRNTGAVLYISGEGNANITKRFVGWCAFHNIDATDVQLCVAQRRYKLPEDDGYIVDDLLSLIAQRGIQRVSAVFFDTYRRTLSGDENSNVDAQRYVDAADRIKDALDCSVVVVHHSVRSKDENRMTGASALHASLDAQYTLQPDNDDSKKMALICQDMKDSQTHKPIGLTAKPIELEGIPADPENPHEGNEYTLVMERSDAVVDDVFTSGKTAKAVKGKNQKIAFSILEQLTKQHQQHLSDGDNNPDQARVRYEDWLKACKESEELDDRSTRPSTFESRIHRPLCDNGFIYSENGYVFLTTQKQRHTTDTNDTNDTVNE